MAKFLSPKLDLTKSFIIEFKTGLDELNFLNNNGIYGHKPFLDYINSFDDSYCYTVCKSKQNGLFGRTITYTVNIYKL